MTTPTQAQIEADNQRLRSALADMVEITKRNSSPDIILTAIRVCASHALTAAAEVDTGTAQHMLQWLSRNATAEKEPKAKAAFVEAHNACLKIKNENAAAEAGEQDNLAIRFGMQTGGDLWKATIERCAQVADDKLTALGYIGLAATVTAAIRALKE